MTSSHIDVLGLGCIAVDFVGTIDKWPEEDAKKPLLDFSLLDGGMNGTAMVAVARLGGAAAVTAKLGRSEMAARAINALKKESIDTSMIINTPDAEPILAFVFVNEKTAHRTIFYTRKNVQYPLPEEFPDKEWYKRTSVLLIDSESTNAGLQTAKIARSHGVAVVIDAETTHPDTIESMKIATHIVVPEQFAKTFSGKNNTPDMLNALRSEPQQTIIITSGDKGCAGLADGEVFELPAYKIDNVVDTTGCGDTFHGAFALAVARNMPVIQAAKFASAAGALCATKVGGRTGIPTAEQLKSFLDARN